MPQKRPTRPPRDYIAEQRARLAAAAANPKPPANPAPPGSEAARLNALMASRARRYDDNSRLTIGSRGK